MTEPAALALDAVRIGLVSISDRASAGVYEDKGLPSLRDWLSRAVKNPIAFEERLIADDAPTISATLRTLVDEARCDLVLTTGGTGPAPRDVTPEATLAVATKVTMAPAGPVASTRMFLGAVTFGGFGFFGVTRTVKLADAALP